MDCYADLKAEWFYRMKSSDVTIYVHAKMEGIQNLNSFHCNMIKKEMPNAMQI